MVKFRDTYQNTNKNNFIPTTSLREINEKWIKIREETRVSHIPDKL